MSNDARDESLLRAAAQILDSDASASMESIADAVGVSRATLHRRYSSRAALIAAIANDSIRRCGELIDSVEVHNGTTRERVRFLLAGLGRLAHHLGFLLHVPPATLGHDVLDRSDQIHRRLLNVVEEAQREHEIRMDVPSAWVIQAALGLGAAAADGARSGLLAERDLDGLVVSTLLGGLTDQLGPPLVPRR